VNVRSARLTLKQHRFEIATAAGASIVVGVIALWVNARLAGIAVPDECFDAWRGVGGSAGPRCDELVQAFIEIDGEQAAKVMAATAVLPFLVGLLGGVPLVGRELEARTAQMAWALAASRRRWLGRQLWPIFIVLGVTVVLAAASTSVLEETRRRLSSSFFEDFGLYGPLVVARAFAALGLGLMSGAALGRSLPAFIVGGLLSVVLLSAASGMQQAWLHAQPLVAFDQETAYGIGFDGVLLDQGWRTPDGMIIRLVDAMALAEAAGAPDPNQWLTLEGYEVVPLGITAETAAGWEPLEIAGWCLAGVALIAATLAIVDRRRPST